ncbi:unnamed protein product [Merluccius merluccius]
MESLHGVLKAFPKVKRSRAPEDDNTPPLKRGSPGDAVSGSIFMGVTAYILPAGIGNARCEIFQRQIHQNGGRTEPTLGSTVTQVVVDDNMDSVRALRLLKRDRLPPAVDLVKCSWVSSCITAKQLLDTGCYSLLLSDRKSNIPQGKVTEELPNVSHAKPNIVEPALDSRKQEKTEETTPEGNGDGNDEDSVSQNNLEALITGQHPTIDPAPQTSEHKPVSSKWVCAVSSECKSNNFNKHITDKLEMLANAYKHQGDKWRALGYSKAINALKSYHKPVTSYEEACQITGIGKSVADKIDEIMDSGHLRKLDHIGEVVPVLELFTNIWGAGAKTAQMWYQQGFRTLEDIRTKANLSNTQKIGLKHYDDLLDRMPREEAAAIEKLVREAVQAIDPNLLAMACGSYRRGKADCGDVDVLITHPDGKSHRGVFRKVLESLHQSGFLTDDLVSHEENGQQKKYMGVCRLPGPNRRHRRLDIIVVPYSEFACTIMYFTGSAHFNRSLRALAKTKNMSLSEHSLNQDVLRRGSIKVHAGTAMATATEKDVFSLLGVPFREPHERDW